MCVLSALSSLQLSTPLTRIDAATSVEGHSNDGAPVGAVPATEPDDRVAADLPDAEQQQQPDDGNNDRHLSLRVQALLKVELGLSGLVFVRVLGEGIEGK